MALVDEPYNRHPRNRFRLIFAPGRLAREGASTVFEGYSIDSLSVANLRRRLDRNFVVQDADHTAYFHGEDLSSTWRYKGYCRAQASTLEFSVDSETASSFEELNCVDYDLASDPEMKREISPLLIGGHGISKKISVPLLTPLNEQEPFGILLRCTLPRCYARPRLLHLNALIQAAPDSPLHGPADL